MSDELPPYLDATAQNQLIAARAEFQSMGLGTSNFYAEKVGLWLAPWASDRALTALRLALAKHDIESVLEDAFLKVELVQLVDIVRTLRRINEEGMPTVDALTECIRPPPEQKFDEYLTEELLRTSYAVRHLDVDGATVAVRTLLADDPS